MNKIQDLKNWINKKIGEKEKIEKDLSSTKQNLKRKQIQLKREEQAREIIKLATLKTQKGLEYHISSIVTTAQSAIFDDPYDFEVDFVERRGKTECDLWFSKNGNRVPPLFGSGLGAVDIAAFALKVASLSMSHYRQVLILDEPFRYLSLNYHEGAGEMIKEISNNLGIQIIMITHSERMGDQADKVFKVTQRKGISKVEEI